MLALREFIKNMPKMQGIRSPVSPDQSKDPQKVFVYGTLKKGYGNHGPHLANAQECGIGTVKGLLFHLGGFPALCIDEDFCPVVGEVYQTSWEAIYRMDQLEGVGSDFYDRVQVKIPQYGSVWTYVFSRKRVLERRETWVIPSGIWRGSMTPKVKWAGFGKGLEIGAFETTTNGHASSIKVAPGGQNKFGINKKGDEFVLFEIADGTILGKYKNLRDFMQNSKPTIRLKPDVHIVEPTTSTTNPTIREVVESRTQHLQQQHPRVPVLYEGGRVQDLVVVQKAVVEVPQAMRLLQSKYGPA